MDFNLEDLPGIGPTKAKRLKENGVTSPLDFIIRGAREISRLTDITPATTAKMIKQIRETLAESGTPIQVDSIGTLRELKKTQKRYSVEVDEIDKATRGGFETQSLYEIYGAEGAGKTQLSFSITSSVMKQDESVWFIDCEGTFDEERLEEICLSREVEYNPDLVKYNMVTDSEDLLQIINTQALEYVVDGSVRVIIIDGLVGLFRMLYHGRGELAERQDVLEQILVKLRNLSVYGNCCVILTNQVMSNPDPFGAKEKAVGGHVLGHSVKYIYAIKKGLKNNRVLSRVKSPKDPQGDFTFFLNEEGVSSEETLKKSQAKKKLQNQFSDVGTKDTSLLLE
jgi:DNA repair protein RadA|tara:strand:- start:11111 stop:12127 length:1017 start_codon:yes stop_codon:yes gene_type:complete